MFSSHICAILAIVGSAYADATSSLPAVPTASAAPYSDWQKVGTFNLTSLNATDPGNHAFITRQEPELLYNRTRQVRHGSRLRQFYSGAALNVSGIVNGTTESLDTFMAKFGMAGLIVVQNDVVRAEKYIYGNLVSSLDVVQSCTKSVLSTALGVAIAQGKLSLDDTPEKWVPELSLTPWANITLRNIIDMTPGIEASKGGDDLFDDVYLRTDPDAVFKFLATYNRVAAPGKMYNYLDENYYVASSVLQHALREPIQDFITREIWGPAGMKYDGVMRATAAGQVDEHGGLGITLGDMARFGMFILDKVNKKGGPRVSSHWFDEIAMATTSTGIRAPGAISVAPNFGYQTGWWTLPRGGDHYQLGDDHAFAALGTYGQAIYIIPGLNVTIGYQSSYPIHYGELFFYGQEFATAIALALKK